MTDRIDKEKKDGKKEGKKEREMGANVIRRFQLHCQTHIY